MPNGHTQNNINDDIANTIGGNAVVNPFGSNAAAALAYKKAEQLMTATHMVTNHVPKNESLRGRVRDISSDLLTDTIKLRDGFTSMGKGMLVGITAQVRLLLSLLDALYASGLISEMNLQVLKSAYKEFIKSLSTMAQGSASDGVELTEDYFNEPMVNQSPLQMRKMRKKPVAQPLARNRPASHRQSHKAAQPVAQSASPTNSTRLASIMACISSRGEVSIGDLAQVITGCSTKTLQRDVNKLIKSGTIIKSGQKRWTKYALVAQS